MSDLQLLPEFNTSFLENLRNAAQNLAIAKKSYSSKRGVITNKSETDALISKWFKMNKVLKCACSEAEFKQIVNVFIDAWEKTMKESARTLRVVSGRQSGGAITFLKLLDILFLLILVTVMIYGIMQMSVEDLTQQNLGTINQYNNDANLASQLNVTLPELPLAGPSDIYNPTDYMGIIKSFLKKYPDIST